MKRLLLLSLLLLSLASLDAQTNSRIKELQNRQGQLKQQIAESESLLKTTKDDVGSQLNSLNTLTGLMAERRKYIDTITADMAQIDEEIRMAESQLQDLQTGLDEKKEKYAEALRYMQRHGTIQQKLTFIFSADNLAQSLRRVRYLREYASFLQKQGEELTQKQAEVTAQRQNLEEVKTAKAEALQQWEAEQRELQAQEREKRALLSQLQKKQRSLQDEIKKKRNEANKLNAQIDKLIADEIAKAEKKAAAEAKKETAASKTTASKATASKTTAKTTTAFSQSKADQTLSANFEQNRGKLPMPISTSYVVVSKFGQYNVEGMRGVTLDNKGIDIQGRQGAKARAVFNGEVTAVFQLNGLFNVLVRHGKYISVYCNLSAVSVKQGDEVSTKQELGTVYTDTANDNRTILHFQLRKEREKLNPERWLNL